MSEFDTIQEITNLQPGSSLPPPEDGNNPKNANSDFAKDILKLVSGTGFAQVLTFLLYPVISRLYAPTEFGIATNYISIVAILTIFACLQYESSILLPKTIRGAANQLALSLSFVMITTTSTTLILMFAGRQIIEFLNVPQLLPFLWLVPIGVFFNGVFSATNVWNTRSRKFMRLSIARVNNEIVVDATRIGLGIIGRATSGSLIISSLLGSMSASITLAFQIWRDDHKTILANINLKEIIQGARTYWKLPVFNIWSSLINSLSQQLPIFMLTSLFSPTITGYYSFGNRILNVPMLLVGDAMGKVFFQRASRAKEEGGLTKLVEETFKRLVLLGAFPMFLLSIIGSDAFIILFGIQWAESGIYTQYLSLWMFFLFISYPLNSLFIVQNRQEVGLIFNLTLMASRFVALYLGSLIGNPRFAILFFSFTGVIAWGWLCFWLLSSAGFVFSKAFPVLLNGIIFGLPFLSVVAVAKWVLHWNSLSLLGLSILVTLVYFGLAIKRDSMLYEIWNMLKSKIFNRE